MILTTLTVLVPAAREWDELTDDFEVRNSVRAQQGLAGIEAGSPDFGSNDLSTDASDAIANILHAIALHGDGDIDGAIARALAHWHDESEMERA